VINHPPEVRKAAAALVLGRLDQGPGAGQLVFKSAEGAEVAVLGLSLPAFGPIAEDLTAEANPIAADENALGGKIAQAHLQDAAGRTQIIYSVSEIGGGGRIQLTSVNVQAGQRVALARLTYVPMP
jgi:hypothetical protein